MCVCVCMCTHKHCVLCLKRTRVYILSFRELAYLWQSQALATPGFKADGYLLRANVTLTLECSNMSSGRLMSF